MGADARTEPKKGEEYSVTRDVEIRMKTEKRRDVKSMYEI